MPTTLGSCNASTAGGRLLEGHVAGSRHISHQRGLTLFCKRLAVHAADQLGFQDPGWWQIGPPVLQLMACVLQEGLMKTNGRKGMLSHVEASCRSHTAQKSLGLHMKGRTGTGRLATCKQSCVSRSVSATKHDFATTAPARRCAHPGAHRLSCSRRNVRQVLGLLPATCGERFLRTASAAANSLCGRMQEESCRSCSVPEAASLVDSCHHPTRHSESCTCGAC